MPSTMPSIKYHEKPNRKRKQLGKGSENKNKCSEKFTPKSKKEKNVSQIDKTQNETKIYENSSNKDSLNDVKDDPGFRMRESWEDQTS